MVTSEFTAGSMKEYVYICIYIHGPYIDNTWTLVLLRLHPQGSAFCSNIGTASGPANALAQSIKQNMMTLEEKCQGELLQNVSHKNIQRSMEKQVNFKTVSYSLNNQPTNWRMPSSWMLQLL
jgi:hypothetical protein